MKCPDCGADVKYYHDPERTIIMCSNKCKGWKVIETIGRKHNQSVQPTVNGG